MGKDEMAAGGRMYIQISQGGKSGTAGTPQDAAVALMMGMSEVWFSSFQQFLKTPI